MLVALFGASAGEAVIWYAGQFYALFFMTQSLKIDGTTANLLLAGALALACPIFIFMGWISDKIGRKKVLLAGFALASLTYFPLFKALTHYGNPAIEEARTRSPAVVIADPATCHFQFDPVGVRKFTSSCDIATAALAKAGVPYQVETAEPGTIAQVKIGEAYPVASYEGEGLAGEDAKASGAALSGDMYKGLWYPIVIAVIGFVVGMFFLKETKDVDITK